MVLKMAKESQDIFSTAIRAVKTILGECARFTTGISKVHYLKSGYVILLITFQWDMYVHKSSD